MERNKRQDQADVRTKRMPYALQIGLFAGLIWGGARVLFFYLGFTDIVPGFLVEPFFVHNFLAGTGGYIVGWAAFTALSIAAALLYAALAFKLRGPWPGIAYGALWFAVLYGWIGPWSGMLPPVGKIGADSLFTDGSVFLLWGVFIGYSIAYEFTDERLREEKGGLLKLQ